MEDLYSCREVAHRYGVKEVTVLGWIHKGKLRAIRPGKGYLIPQSELAAFEKASRVLFTPNA